MLVISPTNGIIGLGKPFHIVMTWQKIDTRHVRVGLWAHYKYTPEISCWDQASALRYTRKNFRVEPSVSIRVRGRRELNAGMQGSKIQRIF